VLRPNENVCVEATSEIRSNQDIYEAIDGIEVGRFAGRARQRIALCSRTALAKRYVPNGNETKFDIQKRAFEIKLSFLRRQIFKTRRSVERSENVSPTFEEQRQKHKVDHTIVDVLQNAY